MAEHHVQAYLEQRSSDERLKILNDMLRRKQTLAADLTEDILCLEIPINEKMALLQVTNPDHNFQLENLLTAHLHRWDQNLAAFSIRHWASETQCLLKHRLLPLVVSPHAPQRVRYSIVDICYHAGGKSVLQSVRDADDFLDLSPAFHALLFEKSLQWDDPHPKLTALAEKIIDQCDRATSTDNKAIPMALYYLAKSAPDQVQRLVHSPTVIEVWREFARLITKQTQNVEKDLAKLNKGIQSKNANRDKLADLWLPLWHRSLIPQDTVAKAIEVSQSTNSKGKKNQTLVDWRLFAGCQTTALNNSIRQQPNPAKSLSMLGGLIEYNDELVATIKDLASAKPDLLPHLPMNAKLACKLETPNQINRFAEAFTAERDLTLQELENQKSVAPETFVGLGRLIHGDENIPRHNFFRRAYLQDQSLPQTKGGFWQVMDDSWHAPDKAKVASLAEQARQASGLFQVAYIDTLGRFAGIDEAALKILDFIRSNEDSELKAIIRALGGIGTPRATQELIASLTRPNITLNLQWEIYHILTSKDLTSLQAELRSAIADFGHSKSVDRSELLDSLKTLLHAEGPKATDSKNPDVSANLDFDDALAQRITRYPNLSSEVRRALRTAQFFHSQVEFSSSPGTIDMSPIVDMQYKALELIFREVFEESCAQLIQRGVLQRKLDVIGYARPIPPAMDEFENHISSLPVVKDIPFFSKFKLRKMLRAICMYRPGKRFTLDGLKAFALFFLCFGRKQCRYGLTDLFPMPFAHDNELAEFCRSLHLFQDFRNRAVHEGLPPNAASDIEGIWKMTANVIEAVYDLHEKMSQDVEPATETQSPQRPAPIIERKVS